MRLENPQQNWKKGAKDNIWITYQGCRTISTKTGGINHGAFFKQHPKSNIIVFDTSNGAERIELHKGGNTEPRVMKEF